MRTSAQPLRRRGRAQQAPEAAQWPWLRFHLVRTAIRPLIEDGRYGEAERLVDGLRPQIDYSRLLDLADYHHLRGWLALATGDARLARQHYELAVESAVRGALPERIASMYRAGLAISLAAAASASAIEEVTKMQRNGMWEMKPPGYTAKSFLFCVTDAVKMGGLKESEEAVRSLGCRTERDVLRGDQYEIVLACSSPNPDVGNFRMAMKGRRGRTTRAAPLRSPAAGR